jgi:hypothetical protein
MLSLLDQEKIALSRFSVSCVSVFDTRGLLTPTISIQKLFQISIYIFSVLLLSFFMYYILDMSVVSKMCVRVCLV